MKTNRQKQKMHSFLPVRFERGCKLALIAWLVVFAVSPMAAADTVQKSASEKFTNNDSQNRDLWKLWYKFGTPESKKEEIWMESTDTWLENKSCCKQGYCDYDENSNGDAWRGNCEWSDCSLARDESTTIQVQAELNKEGSLCIYDVEAEYQNSASANMLPAGESPASLQILPALGFRYGSPSYSGLFHDANYILINADLVAPITLTSLDVFYSEQWLNPVQQRYYLEKDPPVEPFTGTYQLFTWTGSFVIDPNSEESFIVPSVPNLPKSYLYTAGVISYSDDPNDTLTFIHGQEEVLPYEVADITEDGEVDIEDLIELSKYWLEDYLDPVLP